MNYEHHKIGIKKDYFWYKGKAEFIDLILKKMELVGNERILIVGCGTGYDLETISKYGDLYVIDIEKKAIDLVSDEFVKEKKQENVCNIEYKSNYFDLVIAFDVLEHVENDNLAISEIHRVLRKGGNFFFTLPAFNFIYNKGYDKFYGHFRRYNKKSAKKLLKNFQKISMGYWFFIFFIPIAFQRLLIQNFNKQYGKISYNINRLFYKILKFENWLISKKIQFPFGLSIYGVYKK